MLLPRWLGSELTDLIRLASLERVGTLEMMEWERNLCSRPSNSWNTALGLCVNKGFTRSCVWGLKDLHKSLIR